MARVGVSGRISLQDIICEHFGLSFPKSYSSSCKTTEGKLSWTSGRADIPWRTAMAGAGISFLMRDRMRGNRSQGGLTARTRIVLIASLSISE